MDKINLKNMNLKELEEFLIKNNAPKFRAKQIWNWMYKGIYEFGNMKNLPKDLMNLLDNIAYISNLKIADKLESIEDDTIKYLYELEDGNVIESVRMKYSYGNTACISTQVGCKMGCTFCASAIGGFIRNLSCGEMVDQILNMSIDTGERISRVVLMGTGEPFDNFDEVIKFIALVNEKDGLGIGARKITVSTSGLVDKIYKFTELNNQVNLSISLHAPNDEIRRKMMPVARKYSIAELIESCSNYIKTTNRRVTFEYALVNGVNSSKENAKELIGLLKGMNCHVNLIPVNSVKERGDYSKPNSKTIKEFENVLNNFGLSVTIRRELGSDINAACGQLRRNYADKQGI